MPHDDALVTSGSPYPSSATGIRREGSVRSRFDRDDLRLDPAHDPLLDKVEADVEEIVYGAARGWTPLELRNLWRYRELLFELSLRDVQVRYKQTILGSAWAVIQPLMMMVVFTFFLGKFGKFSTGGLPGPVFFYAGFLPWTLFSTGLTRAGNSVVSAVNLVTKIYFPRLIIPISSLGPPLVDFAIAIGVLAVLMVWYGIVPGVQILLAPLAIGMIGLAALAGGLILAALNVSYRDFRYVIPFLVQIWMFATPAIFMDMTALETPAPAANSSGASATAAPAATGLSAKYRSASRATRWLMAANPLNATIAFFRATVTGGPLPWSGFLGSSAVILGTLVVALYYFRRVEDSFADVI